MRRVLLAALMVAIFVSSAVSAPKWKFELFNDAQMSTCGVSYSAPGVVQIHIFQTGDSPSAAASFAMYIPQCFSGAVWIGDVIDPSFLTLGDTQNDIGLSIAYRFCLPMPIHIGYLNLLVSDVNVSCCEFPISEPTNAVIGIDATDCTHALFAVEPGRAWVNPSPACLCETPLAVETKTWGQIKALYR